MNYTKKFAVSFLCLILVLTLSLLHFACTGRKTAAPSYDYYYLQQQSVYYYRHKDNSTSLLLDVPAVYHLLSMALSPYQKMLAFSAKKDDQQYLFIAEADGSNMRRILEGQSLVFSWSPIQDHLGIVKTENETSFFYLFTGEDSLPRLITQADIFEWSPHGRYLCLMQKKDWTSENYILRDDATGLRMISDGHFAGWSSDGQFLYFLDHLTEASMLKVYHYDGILWEERTFSDPVDIHFRHSLSHQNTLFRYTLENEYHIQSYHPRTKKWEKFTKEHLLDQAISAQEENKWELEVTQIDQQQQLILRDDLEEHLVVQGDQIELISFSPNETRILVSVKNASMFLLYWLDPGNTHWEFVGSTEKAGLFDWHPDSSRLAIHMDDSLLIFAMEENIHIRILDESRFLGWKTSP